MFRLRTDEDVHVDVVGDAVLRVRRLTKGVVRWEHSVELPHVYADRLDKPVADTIDGWFGAAGELRLIVHARDSANPRLLPPRELTFAADGPRLERSRPGADRRTLASRPIRTHAFGGMTLQIVQEVDNHVLATIDTTEAKRLGWSVADLPDIGFRWFERSEVGNLPAPTATRPCPLCGALPIFGAEHVPGMNPISVDRERGLSVRVVECHRCLASWQIEEVLEQGTMKPLWKWRQTGIRDRSGRPTPIPAPIPAPATSPAIEPARSPFELTASEQQVHDHVEIGFVPLPTYRFIVDSETADVIVLRDSRDDPDDRLLREGFSAEREEYQDRYDLMVSYEHRLGVPKSDPRLDGNFAWRRYRGAVVRVIAERPDQVLAVAHPSLGETLGFDTSHDLRIMQLWIPRSALDPV